MWQKEWKIWLAFSAKEAKSAATEEREKYSSKAGKGKTRGRKRDVRRGAQPKAQ